MKAVITTIQQLTYPIEILAKKLNNNELIIIGDKKSPKLLLSEYNLENVNYYNIEKQKKLNFKINSLLPYNSYSRKNLGYLLAMKDNDCIYETDDDNIPQNNWEIRNKSNLAYICCPMNQWVNIYKWFTSKELIWPRGFPLDYVKKQNDILNSIEAIPIADDFIIQQGLVNGSPDVDAIWRLLFDDKIYFEKDINIALEKMKWCPFNSQNTWWFKEAFPLMYLPVTCTMRTSDIWRSFVAQRCLWQMDKKILYYSVDVYQDRNEHDYYEDLENELFCFLKNKKIVNILEDIELGDDIYENLQKCYIELIQNKILEKKEFKTINAWISDCKNILT